MNKLHEYIKLMRIKHWMKNGLIFLALVFSGKLLDKNLIMISIYGFFSFSFIASAVYIFNDIKDANNDRLHSIKKRRPIAAGLISKNKATILTIILIIISQLINIFIIKNIYALLVLCIYLMLNILYSIKLKNIPLVDIIILVSGFVIRAYYGAFIVNVEISKWLYLTIMMASFFMAFGKRRNEMIKCRSQSRKVLKYYNKSFLDKFMYVSLILTIMFYSLWSIDNDTLTRIGNDYIIYTIPIVFIIFMKYCLDIEGDSFGDPVDVITNDKTLMLMSAALIVIMLIIIYVI